MKTQTDLRSYLANLPMDVDPGKVVVCAGSEVVAVPGNHALETRTFDPSNLKYYPCNTIEEVLTVFRQVEPNKAWGTVRRPGLGFSEVKVGERLENVTFVRVQLSTLNPFSQHPNPAQMPQQQSWVQPQNFANSPYSQGMNHVEPNTYHLGFQQTGVGYSQPSMQTYHPSQYNYGPPQIQYSPGAPQAFYLPQPIINSPQTIAPPQICMEVHRPTVPTYLLQVTIHPTNLKMELSIDSKTTIANVQNQLTSQGMQDAGLTIGGNQYPASTLITSISAWDTSTVIAFQRNTQIILTIELGTILKALVFTIAPAIDTAQYILDKATESLGDQLKNPLHVYYETKKLNPGDIITPPMIGKLCLQREVGLQQPPVVQVRAKPPKATTVQLEVKRPATVSNHSVKMQLSIHTPKGYVGIEVDKNSTIQDLIKELANKGHPNMQIINAGKAEEPNKLIGDINFGTCIQAIPRGNTAVVSRLQATPALARPQSQPPFNSQRIQINFGSKILEVSISDFETVQQLTSIIANKLSLNSASSVRIMTSEGKMWPPQTRLDEIDASKLRILLCESPLVNYNEKELLNLDRFNTEIRNNKKFRTSLKDFLDKLQESPKGLHPAFTSYQHRAFRHVLQLILFIEEGLFAEAEVFTEIDLTNLRLAISLINNWEKILDFMTKYNQEISNRDYPESLAGLNPDQRRLLRHFLTYIVNYGLDPSDKPIPGALLLDEIFDYNDSEKINEVLNILLKFKLSE